MSEEVKSGLPRCAAEYIELVAKKVRYRRRVRREVREELAGHFEDALRKCTSDAEKEETARKLIAEFGDAKTLATLIRRGKKRCRPVWLKAIIRTCLAAGIAIILLIIYIVWFFSGVPYISVDYVAELNRMVIPAADGSLNAAPYYAKAAAMCADEPNNDVPRPWEATDAKRLAMIRQWVQGAGPAIEQLRLGNTRPHFWRSYSSKTGTMLGVDLGPIDRCLNLAKALCWKSVLAASDGDFKEAFRCIEDCWRFGQMMDKSPMTLEQVWGNYVKTYAIRTAKAIITSDTVSGAELARFQNDMELLICAEGSTFSNTADRLMFEDCVQRGFTESGHICPAACYRDPSLTWALSAEDITYSDYTFPQALFGDSFSQAMLNLGRTTGHVLFTYPNKKQTLETGRRLFDYMAPLWCKTPYEARAAGLDVTGFERGLRQSNYFVDRFTPGLSGFWQSSHMSSAEAKSLPAVIAAQRYYVDKGAYPESLEELQRAGYLKELPMDPWSDGPLVYRRTDEGYTLYSVGLDFKDDGGNGLDEKGKPVSQPSLKGLDIVFWPK